MALAAESDWLNGQSTRVNRITWESPDAREPTDEWKHRSVTARATSHQTDGRAVNRRTRQTVGNGAAIDRRTRQMGHNVASST